MNFGVVRITMKEAISITKQEIEWHEQNKSEAPSMVQAESFIKGLKHLLDLFQQCEAPQQKDAPDSCKCDDPDNNMAPFGDHCLACGGVIRG